MTPTPAPKGQDIEQFRPGFEAWARDNGYNVKRRDDPHSPDEYFHYETDQRWIVWIASKREASTEPSALAEAIRGMTPVQVRGNFANQIDFAHYAEGHEDARNEAANLVTDRGGAQKDEAKAAPGDALDAARYRWLCHEFGVTKLPCVLERLLRKGYIADHKPSIDRAIDEAIATSTSKAGSGN